MTRAAGTAFLLFGLILLLLSCAPAGGGGGAPAGGDSPAARGEIWIPHTGRVAHLNLEGGFFGIVGDDGRNYEPTNLPVEFRRDGTRVSFEARPLPGRASIRMWGEIVEVRRVQKIP